MTFNNWKSNSALLRSVVRATVAATILIWPIEAQIINPVQAAKDAYNKAKQRNRTQTQQQPAQGRSAQRAQGAQGQQAAAAGPFTPPPGTKIEPTLLAPMEQGVQFAVSPRGIHLGAVSHSGSRWVVIYDGVPGPKFDQIFPQGNSLTGIEFSPDGNRYAYCGLQGNEFVVMADGKEVFRDSHTNVQDRLDAGSCEQLTFTSNSKHLYFFSGIKYEGATGGFRFVFDGKADPINANHDLRSFAFSPDGDHVAYVWAGCGRDLTQKLIIDGKPAPYLAGNPQWSADSKHLFTTINSGNPQFVQVFADGKPTMRADYLRLYLPPAGNMGVAIVDKRVGPTMSHFLVNGGKAVPGSECTACSIDANVTFSADGKHYAVRYKTAVGREYVFADGKRGQDYQRLDPFYAYGTKGVQKFVTFTNDPATPVYVGNSGGAQFVVTADHESDQLNMLGEVAVSPVGNHVLSASLKRMTIDGKTLSMPNADRIFSLIFSPDGAHFAFGVQSHDGIIVFLDGTPQSTLTGIEVNESSGHYLTQSLVHFSPDSKHLAYFCRSADPAAGNNQGVCLDGKYLPIAYPGTLGNLLFSEDSNHLFWNVWTGVKFRAYVDGKPVLESGPTATGGFDRVAFQSDGSNSLLVLAQDEGGFKRFSITPSTDSSLATMFGSGTLASR